MPRYAATTEVSIDKSRSEIEHILHRYGATAFMYGWQAGKAAISFDVRDKRYRVVLPLPVLDDPEFRRSPGGRNVRTPDQALQAWEQACRQRWRALALWIKAVLEAEEAGITTLEQAMLRAQVLPNGMTIGDWLEPQLAASAQSGEMPPMLPWLLGSGE